MRLATLVLAGCGRIGFEPGQVADSPAGDDDAASCPTGQTMCADGCADLGIDPKHCGDCTTTCAGACAGGSCVPAACTSNAMYVVIAALPHTYKQVTGRTITWDDAVADCAADEAYLVILDDQAEAAALGTDWVGITDRGVEGTWITVRGDPAPFEPWDAGEPSGGTAQNCARLDDTTNLLEARACTDTRNFSCECE